MLRAWSSLAAQPSSANALRVGCVFSVENRTRPIETLEIWQPWKDDQKSGNSTWRPEFDTKVQRRKWTEVPGKVRVSRPQEPKQHRSRACTDLGAESATRDTARRLGEWLHRSIKALQVKS